MATEQTEAKGLKPWDIAQLGTNASYSELETRLQYLYTNDKLADLANQGEIDLDKRIANTEAEIAARFPGSKIAQRVLMEERTDLEHERLWRTPELNEGLALTEIFTR